MTRLLTVGHRLRHRFLRTRSRARLGLRALLPGYISDIGRHESFSLILYETFSCDISTNFSSVIAAAAKIAD